MIREYLLYLVNTTCYCYCNADKETVCGSAGNFTVTTNCDEDDECTKVDHAVDEAIMSSLCTPKSKLVVMIN